MIGIEFKPTQASRKWRRASIRMHPEGRSNLEATGRALKVQQGWHDWRIVEGI